VDITQRVMDLYQRVLPRGVRFFNERENAEYLPSASWATPMETMAESWIWKPGSLLLGTFNGKMVASSDNRHLVTIAGNRAGKTSSVLLPNLYTYPGSMLVIDPKGELASKSAQIRSGRLKQDVYVVDPFDVSSVPRELKARYNPLLEIDPASPHAIDDAAMLASAMIIDSEGREGGDYWSMAARNFIRGLILFTLMKQDRRQHTMDEVMALLSQYEEAPQGSETELRRSGIFREMLNAGDAFDGIVAATGGAMMAKAEREMASILSTAVEQLSFLDSPGLRDNMAASDFSLRDLARKPTTIYLCLNAGRMATHFRWLRLIIDLAMVMLEREAHENPVQEGSGHRIVMLLEEFAALDHMKRLEVAAGFMAGIGVGIRMWVVLQDLGQLQSLYKARWQTFLGNSGVIQCFGLNDLASLNYVSERLGETSIWTHSYSQATHEQRVQGHSPQTSSLQTVKLLAPFELAQLVERDTLRQVVIASGLTPRVLHRLRHETVDKIREGFTGYG
jgi:type IV secretion system protein VirD4